jgi:hypothetical protein
MDLMLPDVGDRQLWETKHTKDTPTTIDSSFSCTIYIMI